MRADHIARANVYPPATAGDLMNRKLGTLYAVLTAALIATQPPLSAPAAKALTPVHFIFLTQAGLLLSLPFLLASQESRRDCFALLGSFSNYGRLAIVFAVGIAALILYNFSLAGAHPVIVTAILNLSPFWAALVALVLTRTPIPVSPLIFFGCFVAAFAGATAIAWSQTEGSGAGGTLAAQLMRGSWLWALPIPLLTSLTATLTAKWFSEQDASAAVAANIVVGAALLIPTTLGWLLWKGEPVLGNLVAAGLMILGVILADAIGRVFYQKALLVTENDNGYVTMFQNLEPAVGAALAYGLSFWIKDLRVRIGWTFALGLALTAGALLVFSLRAISAPKRQEEGRGLVRDEVFPAQ